MTGDMTKLFKKKKFKGKFDVAVLGFPYSNEVVKPEFEATLTDDAKVYVENVTFLVPL